MVIFSYQDIIDACAISNLSFLFPSLPLDMIQAKKNRSMGSIDFDSDDE